MQNYLKKDTIINTITSPDTNHHIQHNAVNE